MYLKDETLSALERAIGKTVAELSEMDIYEEFQYVESRTKKPLSIPKLEHGARSCPICGVNLYWENGLHCQDQE